MKRIYLPTKLYKRSINLAVFNGLCCSKQFYRTRINLYNLIFSVRFRINWKLNSFLFISTKHMTQQMKGDLYIDLFLKLFLRNCKSNSPEMTTDYLCHVIFVSIQPRFPGISVSSRTLVLVADRKIFIKHIKIKHTFYIISVYFLSVLQQVWSEVGLSKNTVITECLVNG